MRYGKPIKNKRRIDPRYFLEETTNRDEEEVSALDVFRGSAPTAKDIDMERSKGFAQGGWAEETVLPAFYDVIRQLVGQDDDEYKYVLDQLIKMAEDGELDILNLREMGEDEKLAIVTSILGALAPGLTTYGSGKFSDLKEVFGHPDYVEDLLKNMSNPDLLAYYLKYSNMKGKDGKIVTAAGTARKHILARIGASPELKLAGAIFSGFGGLGENKMKLTKSQLKRITKEEIKSLKEAQEICSHGYCSPETLAKNHVVGLYREPGDHEGWLLKDFVNMWKPWCAGKEATEGYNEGNMVYLPWLAEMDSVKRPKYACDYAIALRDGLQDILEKGRVHPRNKKTMENFLTKIGGLVYPTTDIPIAEGQSMKITKQQLKRIIKEEITSVLSENDILKKKLELFARPESVGMKVRGAYPGATIAGPPSLDVDGREYLVPLYTSGPEPDYFPIKNLEIIG